MGDKWCTDLLSRAEVNPCPACRQESNFGTRLEMSTLPLTHVLAPKRGGPGCPHWFSAVPWRPLTPGYIRVCSTDPPPGLELTLPGSCFTLQGTSGLALPTGLQQSGVAWRCPPVPLIALVQPRPHFLQDQGVGGEPGCVALCSWSWPSAPCTGLPHLWGYS